MDLAEAKQIQKYAMNELAGSIGQQAQWLLIEDLQKYCAKLDEAVESLTQRVQFLEERVSVL